MRDALGRSVDYLRLSVTDRCDLRCVYCMPEGGVPKLDHSQVLSVEETIELVGLVLEETGIRKIRLTGGEPLVRKGLLDIIRGLASLGPEELVLTTNGVRLRAMAAQLADAGIQRVNVSLDSLRDDRLAAITRREVTLDMVTTGILAARNAGLSPVKVNCVVLRGMNDDELLDFLHWSGETGVTVRFIEHMPTMLSSDSFVPAAEMLDRISALGPVHREPENGSTAVLYKVGEDGPEFGIIAPLSEPMCHSCSRMRLTADGVLVPCLASGGGAPLRDLLRKGLQGEIRRLVGVSITNKPESHGGCVGVSMWKIGG